MSWWCEFRAIRGSIGKVSAVRSSSGRCDGPSPLMLSSPLLHALLAVLDTYDGFIFFVLLYDGGVVGWMVAV